MGRHQSIGTEALLVSFPYQLETVRIVGEPTIPALIDLYIALCANGAQTAANWCTRGHLVRVLGLTKYQERFPQDVIVIPTHPGIMNQGAAFDYPQRKALHDEALERFDRMTDFDQACLNFIIQCIDDSHLAGIRDPTFWLQYSLPARLANCAEFFADMLLPSTVSSCLCPVIQTLATARLKSGGGIMSWI